MSPTMNNRQSVALNATVRNIFADELHYILPFNARVRVYATASAVGLNLSGYVGDENFLDDQEVNGQNRLPLRPDDFVVEMAGFKGDPVVLRWRNTTGAAITGFVTAEILPA